MTLRDDAIRAVEATCRHWRAPTLNRQPPIHTEVDVVLATVAAWCETERALLGVHGAYDQGARAYTSVARACRGKT